VTTRRGSGIRPTACSWWFGKRIVRKRCPGVYAHIACSDWAAGRSTGFIGFGNLAGCRLSCADRVGSRCPRQYRISLSQQSQSSGSCEQIRNKGTEVECNRVRSRLKFQRTRRPQNASYKSKDILQYSSTAGRRRPGFRWGDRGKDIRVLCQR